ncbi:lipoxygenase-like proteiny domain-containing protein 1-like [Gossypium australe]|uniref:Lipoxygenase-like proteiny domain-containing protein 1-like n=1 Tax=Gossypium australe TaxID=47621 RepID=A0A5B6UWG2_9ROSI|nr:lipoxygenase-like proteiny domain-containing protein 1-like [Gossypium australe]
MKGCQLVSISFFVLLFSVAARPTDNDCVCTLYVKTGWMMKAGTDSRISVVLGDRSGGHGRGSCIGSPCRLNLTSDGSGWHHGWYCDYIEITSTGPQQPCAQTVFYVDQWLAADIPPFQLTAFRDGCYMRDEPRKHGRNVPLIVGNPESPA